MSDERIAISLSHSRAFFRRGVAHQAEGRLDDAVASYRQALALQPNYVEAHNNLGVMLRDQGKLDDAIASYQRAITIMPGYAEAHYNLGNAFQAQRRFTEAVASYDTAVMHKPDHARAFNNRGAALRELKRFETALADFQHAVALKPDFAEAHNNLGLTQKSLGNLSEAEESYRRAIGLQAGYAEAHNNLGVMFWESGKLADALASYERAIALRSDYVDALNNRCNVLIEVGRISEAKKAIENAIQLAPRRASHYRVLAMVRRFVHPDRYLSAMEELMRDVQSLSINDQIELSFAMAKAYEDVGRPENAFTRLLSGNELKRRQIAYNEAAELADLERIRQVFTPELLLQRQNLGEPSRLPVFIVGMPRSGSTLVAQILAGHTGVYSPGELKSFDNVLTDFQIANGAQASAELVTSMSDQEISQFGKSYLSEIEPLAPQAERIVNKTLSNYRYIGLIHLTLPNAAIIHTVRDPADTCISCFFSLFADGQLYTYNLAELGRHYRRYQTIMTHWRRVLPSSRILDVRYEDVVANVEEVARRIVTHCGLEWCARSLEFYRIEQPVRTASAVQVRQPIYQNSVGRSRQYRAGISPLLAELEISELAV